MTSAETPPDAVLDRVVVLLLEALDEVAEQPESDEGGAPDATA